MTELMPEDRDREDDRFAIAGAYPHAPAFRLAASLGNYKGRRPRMATALASMALLMFSVFLVMWLVIADESVRHARSGYVI